MRILRPITWMLGIALIIFAPVKIYDPDFTTVSAIKKLFPATSYKVSHIRSTITDYNPINFRTVATVHIDDIEINLKQKYQKRIYIPFAKIPRKFIYAIISQDRRGVYRRKYGHNNNRSFFAQAADILNDHFSFHASGITNDVVRYDMGCREDALVSCALAMKVLEASSPSDLDKLLEFYVNAKYFGMRSYGLMAASINYFTKMPAELTIAETAYLAGILKSPENYHPIKRTERAIKRRNRVIEQMLRYGYISEKEAREAKEQPLEIR